MSWRTVIITQQSKLDYKMGYMVVRGVEDTHRVLVSEIETLVLENPMVSLTGCLIEALTEQKTKVIFCDSKHNPIAELIPHHGSHDCSAKIRTQMKWSDDVKASIWREVVAEKIRKQQEFLSEIGRTAEAKLLNEYIGQVELFDASNREGHAAKVYFNALFGMDFTRSADNVINAALNYGYSIILSAINREITSCGYLTQIGIFHGNMFNPFNLGCDFMEPFRIIVDRQVHNNMPEVFESAEKHQLWEMMNSYVEIDDSKQNLSNAIKIYVHSMFDAINDADPSLIRFYRFSEAE